MLFHQQLMPCFSGFHTKLAIAGDKLQLIAILKLPSPGECEWCKGFDKDSEPLSSTIPNVSES